jgi:hypothetical protein
MRLAELIGFLFFHARVRDRHGCDDRRDGELLARRRRQAAQLAVELLEAGPAADIGDGDDTGRRWLQQLQRQRAALLLLPLQQQELLGELLG